MLAEYLAQLPHAGTVMHRVRMGPVIVRSTDPALTDSERRFLGSQQRRWADAVLISDDAITIIEAKIIPDPRDVSQLELYLLLLDATPELEGHRQKRRAGRLVWSVDDSYTRTVALQHGLEVHVFKPSHFGEFLRVKSVAEQRPASQRTAPVPS